MGKKTFLILSVLLFSFLSWGRKTDNQFEAFVKDQKISILPKKGFHFNDKAPAFAVFDDLEMKAQPETKTEKEFSFKIVPNTKKALLNFYVCDDAKTVCEQQKQTVDLTDKRKPNADAAKSNQALQTTLYVFSAPWCPACIRLKSETLNKKEIESLLAKVNVQHINIDLPENEKLSDQYTIKAIPTMVLVDAQGEETKRWLDYQTIASFKKEFSQSLKNLISIQKLKEKADSGDIQANVEYGYYNLNKMNYAEASKRLSFSKKPEDLNFKLMSDVYWAQEQENADEEVLKALEKGSVLTTSKIDSLRWKIEYFEKLKELKKEYSEALINQLVVDIIALEKNKDLKKLFVESTAGNQNEFNKIELIDMKLRLEKLKKSNEEQITALKQQLVEAVTKLKITTDIPGQKLNQISYLMGADAFVEAESLYKELVRKYNSTYVYYQKYANFLFKQKRFNEALENANKAIQFAEGNLPSLNLAKIKTLKELNQKEEAQKLVTETMALVEKFPKKYKRLQAQLETLKKELK